MKSKFTLVLILALFVLGNMVNAQTATTKPYSEGSVWETSFIKLKPNMGDDYLKSLAANWVKMHEEAKKQGLIVSYKILSGSAANPGDYDIMLMVEYKNMASMEGTDLEAKWDAIAKTVLGGDDARKVLNENRVVMRDIYGNKIFRELIYK